MIALTPDPIDLAPLLAAVGSPEHGGTALFVGSTRREEPLRRVERLTYEAYEELALVEMSAVAEEARARFGALVAVVHRTGPVEIGEPSVAVAASAGHRPEAFAACRYVIDEVKRRVPIWKRTDYADGASSWVDGCAHDHVHHREAQRA
jgi:molybdopterin synthase catalytic subunit